MALWEYYMLQKYDYKKAVYFPIGILLSSLCHHLYYSKFCIHPSSHTNIHKLVINIHSGSCSSELTITHLQQNPTNKHLSFYRQPSSHISQGSSHIQFNVNNAASVARHRNPEPLRKLHLQ